MSVFEMKVEHKISIYWFGDEPDQPATVPHVLCVHSLGQVIVGPLPVRPRRGFLNFDMYNLRKPHV